MQWRSLAFPVLVIYLFFVLFNFGFFMEQLFNTARYLIGKGVALRLEVTLLPSATLRIALHYQLDNEIKGLLEEEDYRLFSSPSLAVAHLKRVYYWLFKDGLQYA